MNVYKHMAWRAIRRLCFSHCLVTVPHSSYKRTNITFLSSPVVHQRRMSPVSDFLWLRSVLSVSFSVLTPLVGWPTRRAFWPVKKSVHLSSGTSEKKQNRWQPGNSGLSGKWPKNEIEAESLPCHITNLGKSFTIRASVNKQYNSVLANHRYDLLLRR